MAGFGGFAHNDQRLRILTRSSGAMAEFDGLNSFTCESLEGTVKHTAPYAETGIERPIPPTIAESPSVHRLALDTFPKRRGASRRLAYDMPTTTTISTRVAGRFFPVRRSRPMCRWSGGLFEPCFTLSGSKNRA